MELRNEQSYTLHFDTLKNTLNQLLHQLAEQDAEFVVYESNKEKMARAKPRLEYLQKVASVVSDSLMNAEIIWICMQLDLERLHGRSKCDVLERYGTEGVLCTKRTVGFEKFFFC